MTDSVSQLKEGMTRSQVRFLLGTPMVPDAFDDSRWDYYYFFFAQFKKPPKRRLTVYFTTNAYSVSRTRAFRRRPTWPSSSKICRGPLQRTRRITSRARGNACLATTSLPIRLRAPRLRVPRRRWRRKPRKSPIPFPPPSLYPRPSAHLRVRPERAIDLDPVAVARHGVAITQRTEDSDGAIPGNIQTRRLGACAGQRLANRGRIGQRHPPLPLAFGQRIDHDAAFHGQLLRVRGHAARRRRPATPRCPRTAARTVRRLRDWRIRSASRVPRGSRARRAASASIGPRAPERRSRAA